MFGTNDDLMFLRKGQELTTGLEPTDEEMCKVFIRSLYVEGDQMTCGLEMMPSSMSHYWKVQNNDVMVGRYSDLLADYVWATVAQCGCNECSQSAVKGF